jgi:hypothetical protein
MSEYPFDPNFLPPNYVTHPALNDCNPIKDYTLLHNDETNRNGAEEQCFLTFTARS